MAEFERLDSDSLGPDAQKLSDFLKSRIKGQNNAVSSLVKAIDLYNSGLHSPEKPIHVALLIGPAATGKTLLIQSLAEYWFDDPHAYTDISCDHYKEESAKLMNIYDHDMNHAIRANPELKRKIEEKGGLLQAIDEINRKFQMKQISEEEADKEFEPLAKKAKELTLEIRGMFPENPKSIIVFDHLEWADDGINDYFCRLLEYGKVSDSNENSVSLAGSVIFITCFNIIKQNLEIKKIGFSNRESDGNRAVDEIILPEKEIYLGSWDQVKCFFPKNFLSRIDRTYIFRGLTEKAMMEILNEECRSFYDELLGMARFPITIKIEKTVCDFIVKESMDHPEFGARLLKQKFDKYIRKPLGRLKNEGLIKRGDKLSVRLNKEKNRTVFFKEKDTEQPH